MAKKEEILEELPEEEVEEVEEVEETSDEEEKKEEVFNLGDKVITDAEFDYNMKRIFPGMVFFVTELTPVDLIGVNYGVTKFYFHKSQLKKIIGEENEEVK